MGKVGYGLGKVFTEGEANTNTQIAFSMFDGHTESTGLYKVQNTVNFCCWSLLLPNSVGPTLCASQRSDHRLFRFQNSFFVPKSTSGDVIYSQRQHMWHKYA